MIKNRQQVPINVVGSSTFGAYPKISCEKTYNMFVSDGWLVNFAGFGNGTLIGAGGGRTRGWHRSVRGEFILVVVSFGVFRIGADLVPVFVGNINTGSGRVIIDENLNGQVCIVDGDGIYIYNDSLNSITPQTLDPSDLKPNWVTFHNTFFLIGNNNRTANGAKWYVYEYSTDTTIARTTVGSEQALEHKPDVALAPIRLPGRGNNILVLGQTVGSFFTQVGGELNYQRASSINLDYGVVNTDTIAQNEKYVCFIGQNETDQAFIVMSEGGEPRRISTDGIDKLLSTIVHPRRSRAFFFRQDGHLFYVFTFYDEADNITLAWDVNQNKFYHLSDEFYNHYPITEIIYFQDRLFGITFTDNKFYEVGTEFTSYDYGDNDVVTIPRVRITGPARRADAKTFRASNFTLWIEQGVDPDYDGVDEQFPCEGYLINEEGSSYLVKEDGTTLLLNEEGTCITYKPRLDLSFSKNGCLSFSNIVGRPLNQFGNYRNQITEKKLGRANEFVWQLRFYTRARAVMGNGTMEMWT